MFCLDRMDANLKIDEFKIEDINQTSPTVKDCTIYLQEEGVKMEYMEIKGNHIRSV